MSCNIYAIDIYFFISDFKVRVFGLLFSANTLYVNLVSILMKNIFLSAVSSSTADQGQHTGQTVCWLGCSNSSQKALGPIPNVIDNMHLYL